MCASTLSQFIPFHKTLHTRRLSRPKGLNTAAFWRLMLAHTAANLLFHKPPDLAGMFVCLFIIIDGNKQ
jgi:hypothetical protein